ncbi:DNA-binding transcriptional regulator, MarR family [Nonomuraea solani]|uniref:DNA-binding transcriptional regulator, MarR family n=1 Tax=Nonomuraea solani TaxID=1144553 RepID=A0A1H6DTN4_9ACTN|nr:MarR family transcriptional regulator [Nonomuraea solani]SEG88641.1 DNA-binding transcriptional regulator, MarR family [Nonomuraea solani]
MPLGPDDSPGLLLWRATLRWQRAVAAALAPFDLTHVQFVLLACTDWLNRQGELPNQLAVATFADTDVKMTSQVVRKLEEKGLLVRAFDPVDSRARLLRVTDRGAELIRRAVEEVERADAEFFRAVPDTAGLNTILRRLAGRQP